MRAVGGKSERMKPAIDEDSYERRNSATNGDDVTAASDRQICIANANRQRLLASISLICQRCLRALASERSRCLCACFLRCPCSSQRAFRTSTIKRDTEREKAKKESNINEKEKVTKNTKKKNYKIKKEKDINQYEKSGLRETEKEKREGARPFAAAYVFF